MDIKNSKGNVELEGLKVPNDDVIRMVIDRYKKELGDEAVNSLLYSITMGVDMINKENQDEKIR